MSERLRAVMQEYRRKGGRRWKEKLSLSADVSTSLLEKIQGGSRASSESGYNIALACGCSPVEAREIEIELDQMKAKESA